MKRRVIYVLLSFLLVAVLILVACTTSPTANTTTSTINGQKLFNANCTKCHGKPNTTKTHAEIRAFINDHHPGVTLTPEELDAIASYIKP